MINKIVQVRAYEDETVEIKWYTKDGTVFYQRIIIPPKPTREARDAAEQVSTDGRTEEKIGE